MVVPAWFPREVRSGFLQLTLHISLTVTGFCFGPTGQSTRKGGNAQFIGNTVPLALMGMVLLSLLCVPLGADLDGNNLKKPPNYNPTTTKNKQQSVIISAH